MKAFLLLFTLLLSTSLFSQEFIDDSNFEDKINKGDKFVDDGHPIVVVEFWADFNKENAFKEWEQLEGVTYYRCNVADSPKSKDKYRVRMAPTIIIYKDGIKEEMYKTRLDLLPPVTLEELLQDVKELQVAQKF